MADQKAVRKYIFVKLVDPGTVFQETEQRKTIVGKRIGKFRPSKRVTQAIRGGVLVEASSEEIDAFVKEESEAAKAAENAAKAKAAEKSEDAGKSGSKDGEGQKPKTAK